MQVIRTIIWVVLLIAVVVFSIFNWNPVEVTIWDNLVLETKVPALVIISFLLGFLPTWLISRGVIWSLNRKIRSLEIAAKASSVSAAARESDREQVERQEIDEAEAAPVDSAEGVRAEEPVEEPAPQTDPRLTADDGPADDGPAPDREAEGAPPSLDDADEETKPQGTSTAT